MLDSICSSFFPGQHLSLKILFGLILVLIETCGEQTLEYQ